MASFTVDEIDFIRSRGNEVSDALFPFLTEYLYFYFCHFDIS